MSSFIYGQSEVFQLKEIIDYQKELIEKLKIDEETIDTIQRIIYELESRQFINNYDHYKQEYYYTCTFCEDEYFSSENIVKEKHICNSQIFKDINFLKNFIKKTKENE